MSRTRAYRIEQRKLKIKRRKRLIRSLNHQVCYKKLLRALDGETEGLFSKCHYGALGGNIKTKTKNAYASYRHKGAHGKAKVYSGHDLRQLAAMAVED